ncbi:MAG: hypothetical protein IKX89_00080 [Firmicutes bacterium]|nr:hypothetical protein [Bacillota bacterium]
MAFDLCIRTKKDLEDAVEEYGFVPYFRNSIKGFSIEEHVDPLAWFCEGREGVWEWKGPVIRETGCAYGKFLERKAAFISRGWFMDFALFRRDGYDYEGFFNDGFGTYKDKALMDLIEANGPVLSKELKKLGGYRKGGATGFDTSISRLQHQCFVLISDFRYMKDRFGKEYGWGVAEYSAPEQFFGEEFWEIYKGEPKAAFEKVLDHIRSIFPDEPEENVRGFLSR